MILLMRNVNVFPLQSPLNQNHNKLPVSTERRIESPNVKSRLLRRIGNPAPFTINKQTGSASVAFIGIHKEEGKPTKKQTRNE